MPNITKRKMFIIIVEKDGEASDELPAARAQRHVRDAGADEAAACRVQVQPHPLAGEAAAAVLLNQRQRALPRRRRGGR